jgi:hypothetical protein
MDNTNMEKRANPVNENVAYKLHFFVLIIEIPSKARTKEEIAMLHLTNRSMRHHIMQSLQKHHTQTTKEYEELH